jgi:hypothetical protein
MTLELFKSHLPLCFDALQDNKECFQNKQLRNLTESL